MFVVDILRATNISCLSDFSATSIPHIEFHQGSSLAASALEGGKLTRELTTSEYLMSQIDLRHDAFTAEERAQADKDRSFVKAFAKIIIQARSGRVDTKL